MTDGFNPERWSYPTDKQLQTLSEIPTDDDDDDVRAGNPSRKLRSSTMHGKRMTRMQSVGWTINKLRFSNLGVYGRSDETEILEECLDKLCCDDDDDDNNDETPTARQSQLVLVSGYSGTGKSTLARTLEKPVKLRNGIFATGKFDFQQRDQPYAGIIEACNEVVAKIVKHEASNPKTCENIRNELLKTFSSRYRQRHLSAISPELGRFLGLQQYDHEGKEEVSAAELPSYQARWRSGICDLLQSVATFASPVVLVLDDLQWADSESLEIIDLLMKNPQFAIMIVGCYRSNEIGNARTLYMLLRDLRAKPKSSESSFDMTEISVGNLKVADINRMLMDLLSIDDESRTINLARICHRRTNGNPFFFVTFVSMLRERGLLDYSIGLMRWNWLDAKIEKETVATENVVDLIKTKMDSQLRRETKRILPLAACLGTTFMEDLIAILWKELVSEESRLGYGKNPRELLQNAVNENFLEVKTESSTSSVRVYRWAHDRVQEAAVSLIPAKAQSGVKFHAGSVLADKLKGELDASLFIVCNLLNEGKPESIEMARRMQIAELNLRATRKAIEFSSFSLAEKFACKGIEILAECDCWTHNKALSLDLYSTAVEVENILGQVDLMQEHGRVILEQPACTIMDKLRVYNAMIEFEGNQHHPEEAQRLCFEILAKLGCRFPPKSAGFLIAIRGLLRSRKAAKDIDRRMALSMRVPMDAQSTQEMKLLERAALLSFQTESMTRFLLVVLRMLKLTSERGFCEYSPVTFVLVGTLMVSMLSDFQAGRKYSNFGLELVNRLNLKRVEAKCLFRATLVIDHWSVPFASCMKPTLRNYELGLQIGDTETAMLCAISHCIFGLLVGKPLDCIAEDLEAFSRQMQALKKELILSEAKQVLQFVLDMMGRSLEPIKRLEMDQYNGTSLLNSPRHVAFGRYFRTITSVFFGRYKKAADLALERGDDLENTMPTFPVSSVDPFYKALALLAGSRNATGMTRLRYRREAVRMAKTIKKWVGKGNPNLKHQQVLIEAEFAVLDKKPDEAKELYRRAAVQSARSGIRHEAALANERFAHFLLYDLGDQEGARFRIEESMRLYSEWGATRKVEAMLGTYAHCLLPPAVE